MGGRAAATEPLKLDFWLRSYSLSWIRAVKLAWLLALWIEGATSMISFKVWSKRPRTSLYLRFCCFLSSMLGWAILAFMLDYNILKLKFKLFEFCWPKMDDLGGVPGTEAVSSADVLAVAGPTAPDSSVVETRCFMKLRFKFLLITDWSSFFRKLFWSSECSKNELAKLRSQLSTALALFG